MKAKRQKSNKNLRGKGAARPGSRPFIPGTPLQVLRHWYADKAPFLWFGAKFCILTVLFYLFLLLPVCKHMVSAFTVMDARLSGVILNFLGQHNHVIGVTLWSGDKSVISVLPLCSGFDFLCLFTAAVLVFPVPFAKKLPGMLIGIPLLLALNLVRIMSLFFIGIHYPRVFTIVHEEIWAMILVIASIILYITWIRWAGPATRHPLDVTA